jgi:4-aminobutyrate aminotransferase
MGQLSPRITPATTVITSQGQGVWLEGNDGRRYLDFTSGIGVTSTGHCHPRVVEAIQAQAGRVIHSHYNAMQHQPMHELTDRLAEKMPDGLDTLFYSTAGTEAVESAMRMARQYTGKPRMIAMQGGYHGRTVGAASLTTSGTVFQAGLQPLMSGVSFAPFPHAYRYGYRYGWDEKATTEFALRELDHLLATQSATNDTAAIIVEPVLGEGGYVPATEGFLEGLRERCDAHDILLILDEVQSGIGRTGKFWGHQHHDVHPDMVVTAKGLASGVPLSAVAASFEVMDGAWAGSQGGTYGGNALACAAALATLDVVEEEGLTENAAARGEQLSARLRQLQQEHPSIGDVRGRGLMVALETSQENGEPAPEVAQAVQKAAERKGLLLLLCGPYKNVIRFIPGLVVNEDEIEQAADIVAECFSEVAS